MDPPSPIDPDPPRSDRAEGAGGPGARREPARASRIIILPTLNEEQGLEVTLREIDGVRFPAAGSPAMILIDGGSTDTTCAVARRWSVPVLRQTGRGKGQAIREALDWAAAHGFTSAAVLDADATYPAGSLPALFDLLDAGYDLVLGVRRPETAPSGSLRDLAHRIGNGLLNFAAAEASGRPVLDICSGFWGVRTGAVPSLRLVSDGFEIESELFLKAFRSGWPVAQFPVVYRTRVGEAKLHAVRDGSRILLSIIRYGLWRRPRSPSAPLARRPEADLALLVRAIDPARVVLLSAPDRFPEADRLARRLLALTPEARVATAVFPTGASPTVPDGQIVPSHAPHAPLVIALPAPERVGADPRRLFIGIPRTQRFLQIGSAEETAPEAIAARIGPGGPGGFYPERAPNGRRGAWFILGATLDPSWVARELALIAANHPGERLRVFRRLPARPARAAPSPLLPVALPVPPMLDAGRGER